MNPNRPPDTLKKKPRLGSGQIPPNPRSSGHCRAHSETFFSLPDEFLFDSDPDSDFNFFDVDFPSLSDDNISGSTCNADHCDISEPSAAHPVARPSGGGAHLRSLSMDAAFFDGLGFQEDSASAAENKTEHRHSSSMDRETYSFEGESMPPSLDYAKKAVAADKLGELAMIDPMRVKRILANRQSAARSKDRKVRYTFELERKVQTLQTEATTLSAQLTLLQKDSSGLTTENRELQLRLQSMEQQVHLRDALKEALRDEVEQLKIAIAAVPSINGNQAFHHSASLFFSYPSHQPQQLHQTHHLNSTHDSIMDLM